jgi:alpha/beta superfamily hydrolase
MASAPPRSLTIRTDDGEELDGELALAAGAGEGGESGEAAVATVVLCHPHPLYGGDMRSGLIDVLFHTWPRQGLNCLRFDFRGVGASTGKHDDGRAERLDVAAAVRTAVDQAGDAPVVLCGWSFGAGVSLAVGPPEVAAWVAVAAPLAASEPENVLAARDPRPVLLLAPEHDQFRPYASAVEATSGWTATTVEMVPGADHFLGGRMQHVADVAGAWIRAQVASAG